MKATIFYYLIVAVLVAIALSVFVGSIVNPIATALQAVTQ
jgi:hypothetical protein